MSLNGNSDDSQTKADTIRPDSSSEQWQSRYDQGATGWDRGGANPALVRWLLGDLTPPCSILVPGCGRGHEVIELASRGFEVTAVDFARTPVRELSNRLSSKQLVAEVLREDVLQLTPNKPFDAVYEQTCLCAMQPSLWTTYERRLADYLKPGGKLFALFMQTTGQEGPPFHCGLGSMVQLFTEDRWRWPAESFTVDHPSGTHEIAVVLTRRKSKAGADRTNTD